MILIDGIPERRIDVLDRGLAYGDGVFRTMRLCGDHVLHWTKHYAKLSDDCARLRIDCPRISVLEDDVQRVAGAFPKGVCKIVVTRGTGGRGYAAPEQSRSTRIVSSFPYTDSMPERTRTGVRARWCHTTVTEQPALAGIKHLNRLDSVLARSEWTDPDIAEGLMLDREGWVIEGTMSNVFVLEGNRLATPRLDKAGVAGVQRARLFSKCRQAGLDCLEARIDRDRLVAADAVYLTNSVIGLWWISQLEAKTWPLHPLTARLVADVDAEIDD